MCCTKGNGAWLCPSLEQDVSDLVDLVVEGLLVLEALVQGLLVLEAQVKLLAELAQVGLVVSESVLSLSPLPAWGWIAAVCGCELSSEHGRVGS